MSANRSAILGINTSAVLMEAEDTSKTWQPPRQQMTVVATFLWNVATVGFVLNCTFLFRLLKARSYFMPLPPPVILINLCTANLLLELATLLATLTLTVDLGDSGVKAGRVQLFLAVSVLLQSWQGQIMLVFCHTWTRELQQQYTVKSPSQEVHASHHAGLPAVKPRYRSRHLLYRPCGRHSHLSHSTVEGVSTTKQPVSREASMMSLTRHRRKRVRWWVVYAWLLSLLASTALLMTTSESRDACLTMDPFQRTYSVQAGLDVHHAQVRENNLLKTPFLLVLVPVYLAGIGVIGWWTAQTLKCWGFELLFNKPEEADEGAEGVKERGGRPLTDQTSNPTQGFRFFDQLRGRGGGETTSEVSMELGDKQSREDHNLNAAFSVHGQHVDEGGADDNMLCLRKVHSDGKFPRELYSSSNVKTGDNISRVIVSAGMTHDRGCQTDDKGSPDVTANKHHDVSIGIGVSRDEQDAEFLPFLDDMDEKDSWKETMACTLQHFDESFKSRISKADVMLCEDIDLNVFETDEYTICFNDTELDCLGGDTRESNILLSEALTQQIPSLDSKPADNEKTVDTELQVVSIASGSGNIAVHDVDSSMVVGKADKNTWARTAGQRGLQVSITQSTTIISGDGQEILDKNNSAGDSLAKDSLSGRLANRSRSGHFQRTGVEVKVTGRELDTESKFSCGDPGSVSNRSVAKKTRSIELEALCMY